MRVARDGYTDNDGAVWHSLSCVCWGCLLSDATFIGPGCISLRGVPKLFAR